LSNHKHKQPSYNGPSSLSLSQWRWEYLISYLLLWSFLEVHPMLNRETDVNHYIEYAKQSVVLAKRHVTRWLTHQKTEQKEDTHNNISRSTITEPFEGENLDPSWCLFIFFVMCDYWLLLFVVVCHKRVLSWSDFSWFGKYLQLFIRLCIVSDWYPWKISSSPTPFLTQISVIWIQRQYLHSTKRITFSLFHSSTGEQLLSFSLILFKSDKFNFQLCCPIVQKLKTDSNGYTRAFETTKEELSTGFKVYSTEKQKTKRSFIQMTTWFFLF
jgi:hypothetical protein